MILQWRYIRFYQRICRFNIDHETLHMIEFEFILSNVRSNENETNIDSSFWFWKSCNHQSWIFLDIMERTGLETFWKQW